MRHLLLPAVIALSLAACAPRNANTIAVGEPNGSASSDGIIMEQSTLEWKFENVGTEDEPRTKVSLVIGGTNAKTIDMGTYAGNGVDTTNQATDALLTASLWWAGGGDDLRVVGNGDGTLSLEHRTVDEEGGFGEWMTMQTIQE